METKRDGGKVLDRGFGVRYGQDRGSTGAWIWVQ